MPNPAPNDAAERLAEAARQAESMGDGPLCIPDAAAFAADLRTLLEERERYREALGKISSYTLMAASSVFDAALIARQALGASDARE